MKDKTAFIACVGDSITSGNPGVSYTKYLHINRCNNFGLGGDTLLGLSNRIKEIVKNDSYKAFVLEIGANDILLPFLSKYSKLWQKVAKGIIKRGSTPILTEDDFITEYRRLLIFLLNLKIKVIVVSIPCFGEKLEETLNVKVDEFNRSIKKLCEQLEVAFVDFNAWQKEIIRKSSVSSDYLIHKNYYKVISDSILTFLDFRIS